jgi:hypothetical protein
VNTRRLLSGLRPRRALAPSAALLALCAITAPAPADPSATPGALTADQRAIIEQIAKPSRAENVSTQAHRPTPSARRSSCRFAMASPHARADENLCQKDGSVAWVGEVEETGERAADASNALLSGYFAYKVPSTPSSLGGGSHAFAELNGNKLPGDHPPPLRATVSAAWTPMGGVLRRRLPSRRLRRCVHRQALEARHHHDV